jgi:hypothetical protein
MTDAKTILRLFREAAEARGYTASAELAQFGQLKVKWVRVPGWIRMAVPDYLLALSPEGVRDLAESIFRRLEGECEEGEWGAIAAEELSSEAFAKANAEIFALRFGLSKVPAAWRKYQKLAAEQGAELPSGMRVYVAPPWYDGPEVVVTMRTAVVPLSVAGDRKETLRWIEAAAVTIGEGHCGCRKGIAPKKYVEVA